MFYYLYQITNLVNNKIYVGVHKTSDLSDGYMGSGKVIKDAIRKYGIDNFKKDILEFFDTSEAMYAREKEVVTDEFLLREDVYNLRRGGTGGFDYLNKTGLNISGHWKSKEIRSNNLRKQSKITRENGHKIEAFAVPGFKGEDNQRKMIENAWSDAAKIKRAATIQQNKSFDKEKNSQYGTMWITNGTKNKKIKKNEPIPEGWNRGRTMLTTLNLG